MEEPRERAEPNAVRWHSGCRGRLDAPVPARGSPQPRGVYAASNGGLRRRSR